MDRSFRFWPCSSHPLSESLLSSPFFGDDGGCDVEGKRPRTHGSRRISYNQRTWGGANHTGQCQSDVSYRALQLWRAQDFQAYLTIRKPDVCVFGLRTNPDRLVSNSPSLSSPPPPPLWPQKTNSKLAIVKIRPQTRPDEMGKFCLNEFFFRQLYGIGVKLH